jgi:hypothetical protein
MKTILSTLVAVGVLAGAASAQQATFDPFYDTSLALPRSGTFTINIDDPTSGVPRSGMIENSEKPFPQDIFPDITVAYP